jgi:hypothetical protein
LIFFDIISLAQRTVIPRRVFPDLRLLFSGVWSLSASREKKRGRKIEQYKILLDWKWRIQALLRINTEKMHQPRETYVLLYFVDRAS